MKAIFNLPFSNNLPFWLDANDKNLIDCASRISEIDENGKNKIQIETSEESIEDIKTNSGWEFIEDVIEKTLNG